ncbi:transcriptional regulator [Listeria grandensis FSL F6-0971]|uniref:Transcriptional regulator n=1 Tax=Listeria grandensis FSL F6-0971 TaxID=1265819 RepID=W7B885_9LIST|nr:MarR family transcriptional regulator [Listeria grandensis]EUJ23469.1 transcriptional regulator [Listeria grandensis FSL F6-0971]
MTEEKSNLTKQFMQFNRLMHHYQIHSARNAGPFGNPYRGQGRVLSILKMKPEITQKELGYLLDMRNQSLGELLAKLERSEFVTREPSEADRRVMNVKLTEAGKEAAEQSQESPFDFDKLFDVLDEEEQAHLHDYLQRVIAELEKELGDDSLEFEGGPVQGGGGRPGFGSSWGGGRPRRGGFPGGIEDPRFGGMGPGGMMDPRFGGGGPEGMADPRFMGERPDFGAMPGSERFDGDYDGPMPDDRSASNKDNK